MSLGDVLINENIRRVLGIMPWPFMEKERTALTVAGQQFYNLPADCDKIISDTITVGTFQYLPKQVTSYQDWNFINSPTGVQGNYASFFFIKDGTLGFWPIPSSSNLTLTYQYTKLVRDLVSPDYMSGSIVTATSGSKVITGISTDWTNQMEGKYLRITNSNTSNKGDGLWYLIDTVDSATQITLEDAYLGHSIVAGTAAYTIGDCMAIPEKYQLAPVYAAVSDYWRPVDISRADHYQGMYNVLIEQMKEYEGKKSTDTVIDDNDPFNQINPNLNPTLTPS